MPPARDDHAAIPCRVYVCVWLALLALTGLTVAAARLDLRHVAILAAMLIAATKGSLVLLYFMHLRFENRMYIAMLLAALGTYAIFIALTFTDYAYR